MIVTLLYEPNAPSAQNVEQLTRSLDASQVKYRLLDANSVDGSALAELYDVIRRPAVVVTQEDGQLVRLWQGNLPSADDLGYTASL
jgi:hypothetical protein